MLPGSAKRTREKTLAPKGRKKQSFFFLQYSKYSRTENCNFFLVKVGRCEDVAMGINVSSAGKKNREREEGDAAVLELGEGGGGCRVFITAFLPSFYFFLFLLLLLSPTKGGSSSHSKWLLSVAANDRTRPLWLVGKGRSRRKRKKKRKWERGCHPTY